MDDKNKYVHVCLHVHVYCRGNMQWAFQLPEDEGLVSIAPTANHKAL